MTRLRSGPFAAWANSWLNGQASSDEVLRAVTATDAPHQVVGLPDADAEAAPLSEVLIRWRRVGEPIRLVLPVPGDVRGVPGPAAYRNAALEVGEAVHGGGTGLVPRVLDRSPSSALVIVVWHAHQTEDAASDFLSVADAQYELRTAIREAASALTAAEFGGWVAALDAGLGEARRAGERLNLPPGFPPVAVALLAQAERLHEMLKLALRNPEAASIDLSAMTGRIEALRPLILAVRRARLAGYNASRWASSPGERAE